MGACCSAEEEINQEGEAREKRISRNVKNTSTVPHANNAVTNEDIKQLARDTHCECFMLTAIDFVNSDCLIHLCVCSQSL